MPGGIYPRPSIEERLWAKVQKGAEADSCWVWIGDLSGAGYGRITDYDYTTGTRRRVKRLAHRLAWIEANGPVPDGLELDHLCRNRACVRPDHMEAVTHRENMRRSMSLSAVTARTGVCQRGHAMTPDNIYRRPDGSRAICRECARLRDRRRSERRHLTPHDEDGDAA